MVQEQSLEIKQGETWTRIIQVVDALGDAVDLTGYTPRAQMRKEYRSAAYNDMHPALSPTPTDGLITLSLSDVETSSLKRGRWVYDIEGVSTDGNVLHIVEGLVHVIEEVTR